MLKENYKLTFQIYNFKMDYLLIYQILLINNKMNIKYILVDIQVELDL